MIVRRILCLFLCCCVLAVGVLAADIDAPPSDDIVDDVETIPPIGGPADYGLGQIDGVYQLNEDWELQGIDVYAMSPVSSASGLKGILLSVLGPYDTIITQYTYRNNNSSSYSYVNDISPDYPWMCAAALFVVLLYCVFRALGGMLAWRR